MFRMIRRGLMAAGTAQLARRVMANRRGPTMADGSRTTTGRGGFGADDLLRRLPGMIRHR